MKCSRRSLSVKPPTSPPRTKPSPRDSISPRDDSRHDDDNDRLLSARQTPSPRIVSAALLYDTRVRLFVFFFLITLSVASFVDNLMIRDANLSHVKKEANSTSHVYSTSTSSNNSTLRKQQIHFRTYGNHKYAAARERIVKEANGTGWFNTVKSLSPDNLSEDFKEKYRDVLALERGGGYWIWKFDLIEQAMEEMQEGDFLVYLDSGSQINKGGEERFYEYIKMVNASQFDMMCLQLPMPEYKWTTERIIVSFNVTTEERQHITASGQYEGGTLLLQKGPHYRKWMDSIHSVLEIDPMIITDKYNEEAKHMNPSFKDNRHDQSIQSISRKKLGCVVISGRESKGAQLDKPFHVMRKKD